MTTEIDGLLRTVRVKIRVISTTSPRHGNRTPLRFAYSLSRVGHVIPFLVDLIAWIAKGALLLLPASLYKKL